MSYSDTVLRHFWNPTNNRVDAEADATGVAGVPGNGPFMVLYVRLDGPRVREVSFQTHGCAPSIAAGSLLATELAGARLSDAPGRWTEEAIDAALGGLPPHKRHCSQLAAEALARAAARHAEASLAAAGAQAAPVAAPDLTPSPPDLPPPTSSKER